MNKLSLDKRIKILNLLVEGMSLRAISRVVDVSINTVTKLLIDVGKACAEFHNRTVTGITANKVQCDEIWSFVYAKAKNAPKIKAKTRAGDVWTWVGIDADTKLVISWYIGNRDAVTAYVFMRDLKKRIRNRIQLTSDGFGAYLQAVPNAFGSRIDFAQLVKIYGTDADDNTTESTDARVKYKGAEKRIILGSPNPKYVTTSHIERQNLTMRMHMRRFTRLTNAFSKKIENHSYAIALHFVYYNFVKIHKTLRVTPAMEAGLAKDLMTLEDLLALTD